MTLDDFTLWVLNDPRYKGSYPNASMWVFNFNDQRDKTMYRLNKAGISDYGIFKLHVLVEEAILITFDLINNGLFWGQIP